MSHSHRIRKSAFLFLSLMLLLHMSCKSPAIRSDAPTLHWSKLPAIPDSEGFAGSFVGVSGGALIVAGGANITGDKWGQTFQKKWYDSVFVLEQPNASWQTGFKLPHPLGYGVSVSTSDGIICIGGSDAARHYADVFRLAWKDGKPTISGLPDLPRPCANFCGAMLGDTIYVAGGIETPTATTALRTFWKLDQGAKNPHWVELEPWPGPGRMLAVAGSHDGSFYLVSGVQLRPDSAGKPVREYLRDAYAFTPGKGWRRLSDLPQAVAAAPSPATSAGGLLVFSGDDGSKVSMQPSPEHPGFSHAILEYNERKDAWSVAGEVPFSRATTSTVEWFGHVVVPMGEVRPRERTTEVWWAKLPSTMDEKGQK